MDMIKIVHISHYEKTILTFSVEVSQPFGQKKPTAKATLTHIGDSERPFPEEPTWAELGENYLQDYFASHNSYTLEDYLEAIAAARRTALSSVVML